MSVRTARRKSRSTVSSITRVPRMAVKPVLQSAQRAALDQALDPIKGDLEAVTDRLLSQLSDPVARTVVYLITAGGKRLRPALVLLAGACGPSP